jgi:hypothetical protein
LEQYLCNTGRGPEVAVNLEGCVSNRLSGVDTLSGSRNI